MRAGTVVLLLAAGRLAQALLLGHQLPPGAQLHAVEGSGEQLAAGQRALAAGRERLQSESDSPVALHAARERLPEKHISAEGLQQALQQLTEARIEPSFMGLKAGQWLVYAFVGLVVVGGFLEWRKRGHLSKGKDAGKGAEGGASHAPKAGGGQGSARCQYLDSLKVYLSAVVVVVHGACIFANSVAFEPSLNIYACTDASSLRQPPTPYTWSTSRSVQDNCRKNSFSDTFGPKFLSYNDGYFMYLFFFISGVFTPASYDRKGHHGFLQDKTVRLGIPVLFCLFIFNTAQAFAKRYLAPEFHTPFYGTPTGGVEWFIAVLLVFNYIYAGSEDSARVQLAFPSFASLLLCGTTLGLLSVCFDTFGWTPFLIFPTGLREFTHSVAFFTAGVLAGRNGWLEEEGTWLTQGFWKLLLLTLALLAAAFVDWALNPTGVQSAFALMVLQGYWPVLGACVHLEGFRRLHSSGGAVQEFLASAAYGVYLIHPLILMLAAWSYTVVLRRAGHLVVAYAPPHDHPSSLRFVVQSDSGLLMWGGWVYCSVISLITSWPLAWAVKQLPGFRRVL